MSLLCPRDQMPMRIREFFSEGKFMVLECRCGHRDIYNVAEEMYVAKSHERIFLRNRLYEFMESLKSGVGANENKSGRNRLRKTIRTGTNEPCGASGIP